jgi:hypothetical protein
LGNNRSWQILTTLDNSAGVDNSLDIVISLKINSYISPNLNIYCRVLKGQVTYLNYLK